MPFARSPFLASRGAFPLGRRFASLVFLTLLLSACTVRLIGDYDEITDKGVTDLQMKAEERFATLLSSPNTPFDAAVYDDLDAHLAVLRSRAATLPKYPIIAKQLDELKAQFVNLRKLDQISPRPMAPGAVTAAQSAVAVTVESILRLQTALKRGEKPAAP